MSASRAPASAAAEGGCNGHWAKHVSGVKMTDHHPIADVRPGCFSNQFPGLPRKSVQQECSMSRALDIGLERTIVGRLAIPWTYSAPPRLTTHLRVDMLRYLTLNVIRYSIRRDKEL
jgi:hypothetical protein